MQECLNNIIKHSEASEAQIKIKRTDADIEISITDNGKGFHIAADDTSTRGFGLQNIHERVEMLKGIGEITSSIGKGTMIHIVLPLMKETANI